MNWESLLGGQWDNGKKYKLLTLSLIFVSVGGVFTNNPGYNSKKCAAIKKVAIELVIGVSGELYLANFSHMKTDQKSKS